MKNRSLTGKPLLSALRQAVSVYTNHTGKASCLSTRNAEPSLDAGGTWDYQACTEMVMPMCTDGVSDMFEPAEWSFKAYNDTCFKKYSVSPQPQLVCRQYGCKNLSTVTNINFRYLRRVASIVSSISLRRKYSFLALLLFCISNLPLCGSFHFHFFVLFLPSVYRLSAELTVKPLLRFSNGLLDPWASGGVLRNLSSSAIAILIPDAAHHLDLRESNGNDPYSVILARKFHRYSIRKWIEEYR